MSWIFMGCYPSCYRRREAKKRNGCRRCRGLSRYARRDQKKTGLKRIGESSNNRSEDSPKVFLVFQLACALHGLIRLGKVRAGFAGGGNVLSARLLQDFLPTLRPIRIIGVNGEENATALHATLVTLRLILGNAHPDQHACQTPDRAADSNSSE